MTLAAQLVSLQVRPDNHGVPEDDLPRSWIGSLARGWIVCHERGKTQAGGYLFGLPPQSRLGVAISIPCLPSRFRRHCLRPTVGCADELAEVTCALSGSAHIAVHTMQLRLAAP